jgi:hypothetical protein
MPDFSGCCPRRSRVGDHTAPGEDSRHQSENVTLLVSNRGVSLRCEGQGRNWDSFKPGAGSLVSVFVSLLGFLEQPLPAYVT